MKPTERVLEVDSTLTGERVGMGIDESAVQHIMSVLTDLYSDPELAVIREYSTNALDAHRDAGNPLPIEVTIPSDLSPFFRVRDYGEGLDAEDIRSIYSRYGTSTKRDSNDVVGMLGLGCKSALTYTDQFTLVGTKDGRTVQVSVSRDEDGGGSMTIVSDEHTPDAPSGVEVIVPAKRGHKFDEKARDFFRFWSKGSVLVNGEEPEHIAEAAKGTWLVDGRILIVDPKLATRNPYYNARYDTSTPGWVVMGNVPYPMQDESNASLANRPYKVVAFVDIGDVNFTPSREALQMTKRTRETIDRIRTEVEGALTAALQRDVENAATPADALRIAAQAHEYGIKDPMTYKGRPVPLKLERQSAPGQYVEPYLLVGGDRYAKKAGDRYRAIAPTFEGRMIFTGFKSQDFSKPKRDKLAVWLEQQGLAKPKQILLVDTLTADEKFWLAGTPTYDWTPIQAIKVARDTVTSGYRTRPTGSYSMRLNGTWGDFLAEQIPTGQPIVKFHGNQYTARSDREIRAGYVPDDVTIVCLPANRVGKFDRDFPQAVSLGTYLSNTAQAWAASQTPADLEAAWYQTLGYGSSLIGMDASRVDDPDLARCITLQNARVTISAALKRHRAHLEPPKSMPTGDPFAKYPLCQRGYGALHKEHTYLYVNAAYAADSRQGEE